MAETGWRAFGSAANDSGEGAVAWSNPTNALADNTNAATSALSATNTTTQRLHLTGADLSDIPDGATIDGIEVRFRRRQTANHARDLTVQLLIEGSAAGDDKAATATNWSTTATTITYGAADDLWGLTPTAAEIKAATSGLRIRAQRQSGTPTAQIQFGEINVHYSDAPTPGKLDETGTTWNREETARTIAAGDWQVHVWIDCGPGTGTQEIRAQVKHRDDECNILDTLIDEVLEVTADSVDEYSTTPVSPGSVTFAEGDIVTVELYDESGDATKIVLWDGAPETEGDSRLVHPAEGEAERTTTAAGVTVSTGAAEVAPARTGTAAGQTISAGAAAIAKAAAVSATGATVSAGAAANATARETSAAGVTVSRGTAAATSIEARFTSAAGATVSAGEAVATTSRSAEAGGATVSRGDGLVTTARTTTAAGVTISTGTATATGAEGRTTTAAGATVSVGTAAVVTARAASAAGQTVSRGEVVAFPQRRASAAGITVSTGAAIATSQEIRPTSAAGVTVSTGAASVAKRAAVAASGATVSTGTVVALAQRRAAAAGVTVSSAASEHRTARTVVAAGVTVSRGAAATLIGLPAELRRVLELRAILDPTIALDARLDGAVDAAGRLDPIIDLTAEAA